MHETEKETADLTRGKSLIDSAGNECITAIEKIVAQRLHLGLETLDSSGSIEQQLTVQLVLLDQQIGRFRADQPGAPGHQFQRAADGWHCLSGQGLEQSALPYRTREGRPGNRSTLDQSSSSCMSEVRIDRQS